MTQEEVNIMELQPSTTLCDGKYTIEAKIGEGGFGITYKAIQNGLNRVVCIKEYFPAGKCTRATKKNTVFVQGTSEQVFEKYRQAFVREAKMLATLHHPNIVEVLDVFDENNTSYMVMTFVKGKSLQQIVEVRGKLPYPETVNYIAQITNAVGYIHDHHILHRDIKPDNIMITADFKAILIDFGSAREFEQDKTQVHTSMLTHGYAPTEQYTANSRKGSYTDIYAIGATFYFVLTGQVPMESAARLTEQMPSPKDLVPEIPEEANRTILKAMQLKAENRHQTVHEFMDDIRNVKPSVLVDETIGGSPQQPTSKRTWYIISALGCFVALLIGYFLWGRNGSELVEENKPQEIKTYSFISIYDYPMVKVDGGTFIMGSNQTDEDDCLPHTVTLSDFYIGQFEVSQGFWTKIMNDNPSEYQDVDDINNFPVENVSFEEVQVFINRLNNKTGKSFSLPTEAQWEFAARGGNQSKGTNFAGSQYPNNIWFDKNNPVMLKFPPSVNELGIYQMSGNVAEWCLDYYNRMFYSQSNKSKNPLNTKANNSRVVRGGSFDDTDPEYVTVYYRNSGNDATGYIGFRLVVNL
ncbi:MAG: SUMF1/EgtB/PvdO family nonheme iron enzyme [Paludibacteraceae bacterium]|nr:SUMF1/EgtB/PvdO family nonheme iron enzyme [Paludibacteraceae bacterium]